jgi:hypothetical protein
VIDHLLVRFEQDQSLDVEAQVANEGRCRPGGTHSEKLVTRPGHSRPPAILELPDIYQGADPTWHPSGFPRPVVGVLMISSEHRERLDHHLGETMTNPNRYLTSKRHLGGLRFGKTCGVLLVTTSAVFGLTSCSKPLNAASSCKDFLNASPSAQQNAIDKIAVAEHAPEATTPLGLPNVSYLCTGSPNQTLGWAVQRTG